jgi:hypothetical protein
MSITTQESLYEYQIKKVIIEFKKQNEDLKNLSGEVLQSEIWSNHAEEFGRAVLENINDFSGDELFED